MFASLRPVEEVGLGYLEARGADPLVVRRRVAAVADRVAAAQQPAPRCTSSTSGRPACTRSTWAPWLLCSTVCWRPAPPSSSSTTTSDLLAAADHIIDVGPGGGLDGGHILATVTPEDVSRAPGRATGPWLAEQLSLPEPRKTVVASQHDGPPGQPLRAGDPLPSATVDREPGDTSVGVQRDASMARWRSIRAVVSACETSRAD
jgi:hypothetical protein